MSSRLLHHTSNLQPPGFLTGGPGPPAFRSVVPLTRDEDDDDMFYASPGAGEPDDLGDLMQEMRDNAAWVEDLALDCELPLSGGSAPTNEFASPSGMSHPTVNRGLCSDDLDEVDALQCARNTTHSPQDDEAEEALMPCVAAMLMHPAAGLRADSAAGALPPDQTGQMIPVSLSGKGGKGESEPAAPPPAMHAPPPACPPHAGWLQPQMSPFYCSPGSQAMQHAAAMQHAHAAAFFGQHPHPPPHMAFPPHHGGAAHGQPSPLAAYQTVPPSFYAPPPQMSVPQGKPAPVKQAPSGASSLPRPDSSGNASERTKLARIPSSGHQRSSDDSVAGSGGCGATHSGGAGAALVGGPLVLGGSFCDAPSEASDNEDAGSCRQHSHPQVVPDAGFRPHHFGGMMVPPYGLPPGCMPDSAGYAAFPPMPMPFALAQGCDTPAAQIARMARQRSLQRYREKKARRGFGKKIRYQARKANADKRPRVKGRFIRADEAAVMLAAAATPEADGLID